MRLWAWAFPSRRIDIVPRHPDKVMGRYPMPKNPQDAEWVMQQNRVVFFGVERKFEETLFQPLSVRGGHHHARQRQIRIADFLARRQSRIGNCPARPGSSRSTAGMRRTATACGAP